ncbi:hypothetical protein CKA32_001187 [Geitlerinema sp. FC II]|nr:hypothetical protein CKA32_001187 [Geitlerinema sp. FC II]
MLVCDGNVARPQNGDPLRARLLDGSQLLQKYINFIGGLCNLTQRTVRPELNDLAIVTGDGEMRRLRQ